jgi:hypothetical protein
MPEERILICFVLIAEKETPTALLSAADAAWHSDHSAASLLPSPRLHSLYLLRHLLPKLQFLPYRNL